MITIRCIHGHESMLFPFGHRMAASFESNSATMQGDAARLLSNPHVLCFHPAETGGCNRNIIASTGLLARFSTAAHILLSSGADSSVSWINSRNCLTSSSISAEAARAWRAKISSAAGCAR